MTIEEAINVLQRKSSIPCNGESFENDIEPAFDLAIEALRAQAEHENPQPSTNADRIRAMSDDELAIEMGNHAIATICDIVCQGECNAFATLNRTSGDVCKGIIMEWLQQPAEEER